MSSLDLADFNRDNSELRIGVLIGALVESQYKFDENKSKCVLGV